MNLLIRKKFKNADQDSIHSILQDLFTIGSLPDALGLRGTVTNNLFLVITVISVMCTGVLY